MHYAPSVTLMQALKNLLHQALDLGGSELYILQGKQAGQIVFHVLKDKDQLRSYEVVFLSVVFLCIFAL